MYILELLLEKILIIISGLFNSNRFLKLQMSETHFTKQFWKLLGKEGGRLLTLQSILQQWKKF